MIEHLYILPILLFSIVVHEVAHAWVALRCGDDTAKELGRLTLNPIPHIDLVGSILIPLLSIASTGTVYIAWAKPVPVNPNNFANYKRDDVLVSIAGPLSNILIAFGCSVGLACTLLATSLFGDAPTQSTEQLFSFFTQMFHAGIYLNIFLAVFNMIPLPPLDGSHVLAAVLPDAIANKFRSAGFLGLIVVILFMRIDAVNVAMFSLVHALAMPLEYLVSLVV